MGLSTSTKTFAERVEDSKKDEFARKAVAKAQDAQWDKRETAREELGNWQEWRDIAESIRQHTLTHLPHYLEEFSDNVAKRGGHVFFAQTAEEAKNYVRDVIVEKNAKNVVKSKSMVTTEVDIDPMLVELGDIDVLETDLAEFILQVADWDEPSHIVFPALHKNRDQIRDIFAAKLGYDGDNDPKNLARCARDTMRKLFLKSEVGITGCNFAIADTGQINLSTNEGNADLTISIPKTQIVLMGMERIVPSIKEAEILDNMLARSAVGQKLTTYVTFAGQKAEDESDGPEDFHVVIVDNGRSNAIGTAFESVLQCIRCGACLNVCPVYRQIGGHAYGSIYPGPIGSVLSPVLGGYEDYGDLPYASTLCGACTDTCPVKIPLHELLIEHRKVMEDDLKMHHDGAFVNFEMQTVGQGTGHKWMFNAALNLGHTGMAMLPKNKEVTVEGSLFENGAIKKAPALAKGWTDVRDLPVAPKHKDQFRQWYKKHQAEKGEK
ncbi:LutB/LldF family L-lactate oxidation iron-sulfur protein [Lactococcus termiticola]|uniref:Iron-sulfur cluster binding protein / lactate utilization protein LutB n=1 Tax=Lactococcus termiticola TaxID=2169526 RepID=A0A2R5HCW4_9LACT|nr:LutB/LldF family L-lactate oxidation iron-sulfur protein [Lactococcus termiticola]GBG95929.1 iron-sulfur cluster binding protein / lactate utilization protein LutB [Lactococcus termiticola]